MKSDEEEDEKGLVTLRNELLYVRSKEGLKYRISFSIHYNIGTKFGNNEELAKEFIDIYQRFGYNYDKIVYDVGRSSIKDAA